MARSLLSPFFSSSHSLRLSSNPFPFFFYFCHMLHCTPFRVFPLSEIMLGTSYTFLTGCTVRKAFINELPARSLRVIKLGGGQLQSH